MFQARHYECISEIFWKSRPATRSPASVAIQKCYRVDWKESIQLFSDVLANDNPNFDKAHFIEACGMND